MVYNLKTNKAFCLNQTSGLVWQFCDGKNSIADISVLISQELKMLVSEDFVLLALNELNTNNLLENDTESEKYFAGFNRLEVIKQVGLAPMIALPLISTVIAPTAANAQSQAVSDSGLSHREHQFLFLFLFVSITVALLVWRVSKINVVAGRLIMLRFLIIRFV